MFASYGDYTAVQSNNNHIVVCKNDKVVEFINYTRKATDAELLDIMMKHSESAALSGTKPHDNVMTFTDALKKHIEGKPNAEITASNDTTMVGLYSFEDGNTTRFILCHAALRNGTSTLAENIGETDAFKDKDAALKAYLDLSSDMRIALKKIEELRKRKPTTERAE